MLATYGITVGELAIHSHVASLDTQGGHNHSIQINAPHNDPVWSNGGILARAETKYGINSYTVSNSGAHTHTINLSNSGAGEYHNNMSPYQIVCFWHRKS